MYVYTRFDTYLRKITQNFLKRKKKKKNFFENTIELKNFLNFPFFYYYYLFIYFNVAVS